MIMVPGHLESESMAQQASLSKSSLLVHPPGLPYFSTLPSALGWLTDFLYCDHQYCSRALQKSFAESILFHLFCGKVVA